MRIGIVCPYSFDYPGGVQAHILNLANELIKRGHEVRVLGPASEDSTLPSFVHAAGPSMPLRYNGSIARVAFGLRAWRETRAFIKQGRFDVLHAHEPNAPSVSLIALILATGPIVATYHASAERSRVLRIARPWLRSALERIRAGIAVSEMARRWQVEQLGGDSTVIPNGIDIDAFARCIAPPVPEEPVEIVFVGRFDEPRKGFSILLEAYAQLNRKIRFTAIGVGSVRPVEGVDFVGFVSEEEKARLLGRADIFVAPNTGGESFGIILTEAMAAGCAVVASDLEAFAAVCAAETDRPAGRLFPTGNARALASTLRELIDDPKQRQELVAAGWERVQDKDWSVVGDRVSAVYNAVREERSVRLRWSR